MDYGYDKEREDDLNERRLRNLPRYTLEQLEKAETDKLRSLSNAIETERKKPQTNEDYIRMLDSWHRVFSKRLKKVEEGKLIRTNE